jgi:DNA processing protein
MSERREPGTAASSEGASVGGSDIPSRSERPVLARPSGPARSGESGRMSIRPPATRLEPEELAAAMLVCLPDMTPARLRLLLQRFRGPTRALAAVQRGEARDFLCDGAPPEDIPNRLVRAQAWERAVNDDALVTTMAQRGPHVFVAGAPRYPIPDDVPSRPAVLLAEGAAPEALERPRVAVVGTRAATPHGLADAREVGAVLAEAGVTVVSGMAIGIDGAAHDGALGAGGSAVGVLATGLDVVYPRRHVALFDRVRRAGLLVSELGYGIQPRPGAFPVRNRIIALLADVVVVIEATMRGGARITADRALEFGRPVLAMPGSRRNPAAEGTNALIADGAHPLLDPSDVVLALGLTPGARRVRRPAPAAGTDAGRVLTACGGEPASVDQLASRTGLAPDAVAVAVRALERDGWIERARGLCWPKEAPM